MTMPSFQVPETVNARGENCPDAVRDFTGFTAEPVKKIMGLWRGAVGRVSSYGSRRNLRANRHRTRGINRRWKSNWYSMETFLERGRSKNTGWKLRRISVKLHGARPPLPLLLPPPRFPLCPSEVVGLPPPRLLSGKTATMKAFTAAHSPLMSHHAM